MATMTPAELDPTNILLRDRYLAGFGIPRIAAEVGRSQCFVHGRLKKIGVQFRPPGNPDHERPYRRTPRSDLQEAVSRYLDGESAKAIADGGIVSKSVLLAELRSRGISIRKQAAGTDSQIISAYQSGMSVNVIEITIGCTKRRASNVLKSAGIPLRLRVAEKTPITRLDAAKRRQDRLRLATPPWADLAEIKRIHAECRLVSKETGVPHHTDHVYPLRGDMVPGLNVPANLRIITRQANVAKKAKVDPEMLDWVVRV